MPELPFMYPLTDVRCLALVASWVCIALHISPSWGLGCLSCIPSWTVGCPSRVPHMEWVAFHGVFHGVPHSIATVQQDMTVAPSPSQMCSSAFTLGWGRV